MSSDRYGPWEPAVANTWRMVRPFTLTRGRTRPSRDDFTLITLVTTVGPPNMPVDQGMQPEHAWILHMCAQPLAVVEIAAQLDLPVSTTTILLCDLLEQGRIEARPPIQSVASAQDQQIVLLQKVRDGLARL